MSEKDSIERLNIVMNYSNASYRYLQLNTLKEALRQLILSWETVSFREEYTRNNGEDIELVQALENILKEQER